MTPMSIENASVTQKKSLTQTEGGVDGTGVDSRPADWEIEEVVC